MEPYRPFVDVLVVQMVDSSKYIQELNKELKTYLLQIPIIEVIINDKRSPLMVAAAQTTGSLAKCFLGESRKLIYPIL